MSLKYEPSSEPIHISTKKLFLNSTLLGMASSEVRGIPPVEAFVDFEVFNIWVVSLYI